MSSEKQKVIESLDSILKTCGNDQAIKTPIESCISLLKGNPNLLSQTELKSEFSNIVEKFEAFKVELLGTPENSKIAKLPQAGEELTEVIKQTEESTDLILTCAEKIQSICQNINNKELEDSLLEETTKIFEACNFQDLTSQRITKVGKILTEIEKFLGNWENKFSINSNNNQKASSTTDEDFHKKLLNGPATQKDAPSQDNIDDLFNET